MTMYICFACIDDCNRECNEPADTTIKREKMQENRTKERDKVGVESKRGRDQESYKKQA